MTPSQKSKGKSQKAKVKEGALVVRTLAADYSSGYAIPEHRHDWHQLIYASRGVMTVETEQGAWVAPSQRAVWVPAGVAHRVAMTGWVAMRTLYVAPAWGRGLPRRCCVMNISALLRELILEVTARRWLDRTVAADRRMIGVIRDQLVALPAAPLDLPMPRDPRAVRVAQAVSERPGERSAIEELARGAGASKRTIERLFQRETGMTFGRWRQQARLLEGLRRLAAGDAVKAAAVEAGYRSASAFVTMFRRALGTTPRRYSQ